MLSKTSDRERQAADDFTYIRNLKNKTNKQTKQKQTDRYKGLTEGREVGGTG